MNSLNDPGRRMLLKSAAALSGVSALGVIPSVAIAQDQTGGGIAVADTTQTGLQDSPLSSGTKLTIERRGQIVLFGINRPYIQNRIDPETFEKLAEAYYQYDHDPSLRAAILFGHGENLQVLRGQKASGR
jgi:enoyl-CoA hydratase